MFGGTPGIITYFRDKGLLVASKDCGRYNKHNKNSINNKHNNNNNDNNNNNKHNNNNNNDKFMYKLDVIFLWKKSQDVI